MQTFMHQLPEMWKLMHSIPMFRGLPWEDDKSEFSSEKLSTIDMSEGTKIPPV